MRTNSVILAPAGYRFAALSYLWGGSQYIVSDNEMRNLPFQLPHAPVLSQTIVNAMSLCEQLDIGYLWVDALCITQGPTVNPDKAFQLQQMDCIYRSAVLTICETRYA